MLSILSSLVLASVAFVPGAAAGGLRATSHADREGTVSSTPVNEDNHRTSVSFVKCHASSTAESFSASANGFAEAMADAFKIGCSLKLDEDWKKMAEHMFDDTYAFAWAYAEATADAHCVSRGNAYGCALAKARAKAWAAAVIEVYADAWATAINVCKCNGKPNAALATTYGSAHEFEYLFAKVEAEASAKVCVRGDDEDWVHADAVCSHKIFAYGFAAAWAKALIDGECYDRPVKAPGGGLEADAKILALAKIEVWEKIRC